MGKKSRDLRKEIKTRARAEGLTKKAEKDMVKPRSFTMPPGFRVDELGELRRVETKAQARQRYLRQQSAIQGLIADMLTKAAQEIQEVEDASFFAGINAVLKERC
jgi:hypothetical protein